MEKKISEKKNQRRILLEKGKKNREEILHEKKKTLKSKEIDFTLKKKFYMYSNGLQSHNIPFLLNNSTTAIQQCTIY